MSFAVAHAERGSGGALGKTPNRLNATASVPRIPTLCQCQNVRIRPALESIVGVLLDDGKVFGAVVRRISTDLDNNARLRRFLSVRFVTGSSARPGVR